MLEQFAPALKNQVYALVNFFSEIFMTIFGGLWRVSNFPSSGSTTYQFQNSLTAPEHGCMIWVIEILTPSGVNTMLDGRKDRLFIPVDFPYNDNTTGPGS